MSASKPGASVGGARRLAELTWEEVRDLKAQGFNVEAHSKTHSNLAVPPCVFDAQQQA